ncbi:MAG: thiamine-phosphate kinase [Deltaproteobacteria bacterium]|nr:thiamine-phosphate kinase [Deltaproteobacteria bacterium]MBW2086645.1 thiamine-phosphate kinase [Deltaproteobacteria bacterium]
MTKLKDIGELDLIKGLAERFLSTGSEVLKGIGDDCAVLRIGNEALLLTTDILVEGVHFTRDNLDPAMLAQKLLAINLSDIAAMGGRVKAGLLTVALTPETELAFWEAFASTLYDEFRSRHIDLLGGDTSSSPGPLIFNLVLLGRADPKKVLYRSGGRAGDLVFVSRPLGDAAAGLALQDQSAPEVDLEIREYLRNALESPRAEEELGLLLAESGLVTSMIDVSDGLATDLNHLVEASALGAEIFLDDLPLSKEAQALANELNVDPIEWALFGGEDYALLFTVPGSSVEALRQMVHEGLDREIWRVAQVTPKPGLFCLSEGRSRPLTSRGYEHFRSKGS